jgi:hypothetical protein
MNQLAEVGKAASPPPGTKREAVVVVVVVVVVIFHCFARARVRVCVVHVCRLLVCAS